MMRSDAPASRPLGWTCALSAAVLLAAVFVAGCTNKSQSDAVTGGAGGATAGAAGSADGNAGRGALVGGAVGLNGAGMAGNTTEKQEDKVREERPAGR